MLTHRSIASFAQRFEGLEPRRLLAVTVGFEDLEIGPAGDPATGVYDDPSGFRFTLLNTRGQSPQQALQIFGLPQGYASNVLHAPEWAQQVIVTRADGQPFDFVSLDYAASRHGDAGDFVISAQRASGTSAPEQTIDFSSSKALSTLTAALEDIVELRIDFGGASNNAYGALDNFVFGDPGGEGPPSVIGSLADPDPVAGPARLFYDERDWHEVDQLAPLPDGSFYTFGRSGEETQPLPRVPPAQRTAPENVTEWVTKHFADGSIDRSFGDNGRLMVSDLPWDGLRYELTPIGNGQFTGVVRTATEEHVALFDSQLQRVTSFADEGILRVDPLGAVAVFDDGGLVVGTLDDGGESALAIYSPDGDLVGLTLLEAINDQIFPGDEGRRGGGLRAIGTHTDGFVFLGLLYLPEEFDNTDPLERPFVGVARLTAALELDTSYGINGVARDTGIFPMEGLGIEDLFVGADGRAAIGVEESDSDSILHVFSSSGESVADVQYFGSADFGGGPDATLLAVSFLPDDDVAIAYSFVDTGVALVVHGTSFTGFAVDLYDFGAASGGGASAEFRDREQPADANDAFVAPGGGIVLGGFVEDVTLKLDEEFQQELITAIDHLGALWHVDFFPDGDDEPASVDFEGLPVGFIHSGVYEQDGFVFANVPGDGGLPSDPLRADDESQGYESTVLTVFNWARRLDVRRADGSPFSLERFDYAAGRWNEPGDLVLTGHFSDGSTDTRVVQFDSRAMTTLDLNWDDVVSFDLNFAGGENNAYGAVDNFVFA